RAAGVEVLVTVVCDIPQAFAELARVLEACGATSRPRWLDEAETTWSHLPRPEHRTTAVVPIWRRPWMVLGRDTFAGDVLGRLGVTNVFAGARDRYPRLAKEDLAGV